jgi:aldose 1-epimerase
VRGEGVDLFILTNARGMEARITNYGAVITAVRMPGRDGKLTNVVQGFDSLAEYTSQDYKGRYGAVIGRFANRIMDNSYRINNVNYRVARDAYVPNDDNNNRPYDERVWSADTKDGAEPQLILSLTDRNGSMGFPGTLRVQVIYTLTRNNVLRIDYRARSDKDTIVNLTNHAYFNMAGDASGSVLDQLLTVNADTITVGDDKNVPTGAMRKVAGTAFDFRTPTPIGAHVNDPDPAIQLAKGFDQNYALNGWKIPNPDGCWKNGRRSRACRSTAPIIHRPPRRRPKAMPSIVRWRWKPRASPTRPMSRAFPARS